MGTKIAITGSSSTMAKLLIGKLLDRDEIEEVRGLDIHHPEPIDHDKFTFVRGDVRERKDLRKLTEGMDIVIHMAFVLFVYPKNEEHLREIREINVEGSKNVFQVSAERGVQKVIYISSVAAYGFHYDRDLLTLPLREDDPLDGDTQDNFYLQHKKEIELFLNTFQETHPEMIVSRLRPHLLAGPEYLKLVNLKPYKDGLRGSFYLRVSQPHHNGPPTEQLVHEDDVIAGILYCIDNNLNGAMNIVGDSLDLRSYLEDKSIRLIQVPLGVARFFLWFKAIFSEIGRLERYWTKAMVHPVIVTNHKFKELVKEPISTEEIFDEMYDYLNAE